MNPTLVRSHSLRNVYVRSSTFLFFLTNCLLTLDLLRIVFIAASNGACIAQDSMSLHPYLTPRIVEAQQILQAPSKQQLENSFEKVVQAISDSYRIPMWIDRRIARDTLIQIPVQEENLEGFLNRAAQKVNGVVLPLEGALLIAPNEWSGPISSAYWTLRTTTLPKAWSSMSSDTWGWTEGSTMQQIAKSLCRRYKLEDGWVASLPHDIWAGSEFDKVPNVTICLCVLSSMEMQLKVDGKVLSVEPMIQQETEAAQVSWLYRKSQIDELPSDVRVAWKQKHPASTVQSKGDRWEIFASPMAHRELVARSIPPKKWVPPNKGKVVYSGNYQGSLAGGIKAISQAMSVEFFPLPLPDKVAVREVKIEYKNATMETLLEELGKSGGVRFQKAGERYEISILETP